MKGIKTGKQHHARRGVPKANPDGKCFICDELIINRKLNACYCESCGNICELIRKSVYGLSYTLRLRYPDVGIKVRVEFFRK